MKINADLIKRSFKSWTIRASTATAIISGSYAALSPEYQLSVFTLIQPYLPSGGVIGVIVGIVGILLRAKTTKPLSER